MPQGRSKNKLKLPGPVKSKRKYTANSKPACHARKNAPVPPKVTPKTIDKQKLSKAISKELLNNLEADIRSVAFEGKQSLLSKKELKEREEAE